MPETRYPELHDAGHLESIQPGDSPYGPVPALRHFDPPRLSFFKHLKMYGETHHSGSGT
jgi:hypothetical protein